MMPLTTTLLMRYPAAKTTVRVAAVAQRLRSSANATTTMRPLSTGSSSSSSSSRIPVALLRPTQAARHNMPSTFLMNSTSSSPSNTTMTGTSTLRCFSSSSESTSSLCPKQIQKRLNDFQDLFVEARMCIDDVKDSVGTVYFDEDADEAREAVEAAIENFETLTSEITDLDEKNKVLRGNGLKVEQLKGELELTLSGGHDH